MSDKIVKAYTTGVGYYRHPFERYIRALIRKFDKSDREGLDGTPERYLKFLKEVTTREEFNFTVFDAEGMDQMIIEKSISFYSLCEHHLVPFFGVGHIAYVPDGRIAGLSKLARTLEYYSRGFQTQERITQQVASRLQQALNPKGVAVVLEAEHLCMTMRGVRKAGTKTITSAISGVFQSDVVRTEFMNLIK